MVSYKCWFFLLRISIFGLYFVTMISDLYEFLKCVFSFSFFFCFLQRVEKYDIFFFFDVYQPVFFIFKINWNISIRFNYTIIFTCMQNSMHLHIISVDSNASFFINVSFGKKYYNIQFNIRMKLKREKLFLLLSLFIKFMHSFMLTGAS